MESSFHSYRNGVPLLAHSKEICVLTDVVGEELALLVIAALLLAGGEAGDIGQEVMSRTLYIHIGIHTLVWYVLLAIHERQAYCE